MSVKPEVGLPYINQIISNATKRLDMLFRVLRSADMPTKKIVYFLLIVRLVLEFASKIWNPYQKKQIRQLEKIQNKALLFIFNIKD